MFRHVMLINCHTNFMNPSLTFTLSIDINRNQPVVVVTQCKLANHLPIGLVSCVQVRCGACK